MKLKGISPLEQNVDRIVLGVVVLVFAGALALQFLGPGNMVKVGNTEVPAPLAFDPVVREAKTLAGSLDRGDLKTPDLPAFTLANKLTIGAGAPRLAKAGPALGRAPSINTKINVAPINNTFAAIELPAPTSPVAVVFQSTISPVEQVRNKELAKVLPAEQPFDKAAVSVEAIFSGAALREALQKDPDGDGPIQPMPRSWWLDNINGQDVNLVDIVAVEVERELLRNPDGTTPDQPTVVKVPPLPGRTSMRAQWDQEVHSLGDMPGMVTTVSQAAEEVQRPKYYETIAGPEWKEPTDMLAAGSQNNKINAINRLRKELDDNAKEMDKIQKMYDAAPDPSKESRPPDRSGEQTPPTRSKGGGVVGGNRSPGRQDDKPKSSANKAVLGQKLEQLKADRDRISKRLAALGEKVEGIAAGAPGGAAPAAPTRLGLLDNPSVKIWTHDMTAEPGATYRYRVRVVMNNPMYGRNLQPDQAQLAANSLIESPWSPWSEEVGVDRPDYFFITSAEEPMGAVSPRPSAGAEIYKFYYGYYRLAKVPLEPGDSLMGDAKLPADLKLADMDRVKALVNGTATADAGGQTAPPAVPPPPAPTGKGVMPAQGSRGRLEPGPQGGQEAGAAAAPDADWLNKPAPKQLPLKVDAVFLDVAKLATTTQDVTGLKVRSEALFRDDAGRVLAKFPDDDKNQDVYKRVFESAKAGESQGKPVAKPVESDKPAVPKPNVPPPPLRRPGGGGAGGGGGGGGG